MSTDFFERVGTDVRSAGRMPSEEYPSLPYKLNAQGCRAWAESDGMFWGTASSHQALPSAVYRMAVHDSLGPVFLKQKNDTDALCILPDSESAKVIEELKRFKGLREQFRAHGFLYKRGILMWGPPGSGKTCTLQLILNTLMAENESVGVLIDRPNIASQCLQSLRRIEPDRQLVAILEDLDALCDRYGESEYLALLDGEAQVDNVIWIGTTNYPERLDLRFVDRPSRFDTIRYIGMPTAEARRMYFNVKAPEVKNVEEYVASSEGYSIAHLRELVILTQCFELSLKDACARLNKTRKERPSSERQPGAPKLGFA